MDHEMPSAPYVECDGSMQIENVVGTRRTDCRMRSEFMKTDVTAVEIILNFIFVGIGNILQVFGISNKKRCLSYPVLKHHRIHGIRLKEDTSFLVCYGNREIIVTSIQFDSISVTVISRWIVGEWIWDVRWQNDVDEIMILSANNVATLWNWRTKQQLKRVTCAEKCLLYCGLILGDEWKNSVIVGGSMFKCIRIWSPVIVDGETCQTLHKLAGHKGAIFSVFYHHKLRRMSSTSDDRSVRIWQVNFPERCNSTVDSWANATIVCTITVYGHMSRVWKSVILDDARFITAGEDSQLRIWNENGSPVCYWETHQEASIRSLSVDEKQDLIVTGGKDGGLSMWTLYANETSPRDTSVEIQFSSTFSIENVQDVPRRILLSKSGALLTVTNEGMLFIHDGSNWNCVISDPRFASYCLFQISNDRRCVCLASISGYLMILKESDDSPTMRKVYDDVICCGRIFSFHWLSYYQFIICSAEGCLEVWNLNFEDGDEYRAIKLGNFTLPPCKERWLTSAVQIDELIIVGDRDGSIHAYSDKLQPLQTFHRIHGRLGVSCIGCDGENKIFSVGRDGYVRYWFVFEKRIEHAAADKLPVKWPARIIRSQSCGLLVLGFNEVNFEVWNIKERKQLLTYNCGGGHRPWDFTIDECVKFVYIREKVICSLTLALDRFRMLSLVEGFHIREIDCLRFLTGNVIISGSEDTTLRVSSIDGENTFKPVATIRSHISSVRTISFLRLDDDSILIVSAGGRAQLKIWKMEVKQEPLKYQELASHMLKPTSKCKKSWQLVLPSFELEPRHMDVCIRRIGGEVYIYAAGSDAFWRIFTFNLESRLLQLVKEIEYASHCILKIIQLIWFNLELVVTMSTDGLVTFWDANAHTVVHRNTIHQSGINSCDYIVLPNGCLALATGGDDTSLKLSSFVLSNDKIEAWSSKNGSVHEAQVSGLCIIRNYIVTAGGDQKVALWKWEVANDGECQLELSKVFHSFVPDIHGLDLFITSSDEVKVCVYGAGFEVLKMTL